MTVNSKLTWKELMDNTVLPCGCKVFKDGSRILCVTHK